jgi:hypothetical protein
MVTSRKPEHRWEQGTVKIGSIVSTDKGGKMEQPTLQRVNLRTWRRQEKERTADGKDMSDKEGKYQQEIKEIQEKCQKRSKTLQMCFVKTNSNYQDTGLTT